MRALPSVQGLWENKKDQGLHIFLIESQGGSKEDLEQYAKDRGLTFPIAIRNSCDFREYSTPGGLPYAMVIGPDGKIAWEGRKGYEGVIDKQLERIKYPGLGKLEVHKDCEKAASYFADKQYGKAREEAADVLEDAEDEEAKADAQFIVDRVDAKVKSMKTAVDEAIDKKRYHDAIRILEELESRAFKGMDEVQDEAESKIKELESDKEVKEELKAWDRLEKTLKANERARNDAQKRANLIKFWEKYEGTAAAEEAKKLADALEG